MAVVGTPIPVVQAEAQSVTAKAHQITAIDLKIIDPASEDQPAFGGRSFAGGSVGLCTNETVSASIAHEAIMGNSSLH